MLAVEPVDEPVLPMVCEDPDSEPEPDPELEVSEPEEVVLEVRLLRDGSVVRIVFPKRVAAQ